MDFPDDSYGARDRQSSRDWDRRSGRERSSRSGSSQPDWHENASSNSGTRWSTEERERDRSRDRDRERSREKDRDRDRDRDRHRDRYRDRGGRDRDRDRERDRDRRGYSPRSERSSRRDSRENDRDRRDSRGGSRDRRSGRDSDGEASDERRKKDGSANGSPGWSGPRDMDLDPKDADNQGSISEFDPSGNWGSDPRWENTNYKDQTPNNTIVIRGLAQHISENDIRQDVTQCGLAPKAIRLIRKKDTGTSRGFAFIEFKTVQDASRWMEMKQGVLMLQDQYRAVMQFSFPKSQAERGARLSHDWTCQRCGGHNFKNRITCYTCQVPRPDSDEAVGADEVSPHPTSMLLLRGLDPLSTEDSVLASLKAFITIVPLRSIQISRDPLTRQSRGICYLELRTVFDSVFLYNALHVSPPVVDGRRVLVSFGNIKPVPSGLDVSTAIAISAANSAALAAAQINHHQLLLQQQHATLVAQAQQQQHALAMQQQQAVAAAALLGSGHVPGATFTLEDVPRLAEYSASMYASTTEEHAVFLQYYTQYYTTQIAEGSAITLPGQLDSVLSAHAALQQLRSKDLEEKTKKSAREAVVSAAPILSKLNQGKMAVAQAQAAAASQNQAAVQAVVADTPKSTAGPQPRKDTVDFQNTKHPPPDVSTYQYDETSGYYYDPSTGLYFDPNTQYYYNAQSQQFMYWDSDLQTYLPAPTGDAAANAAPSSGAVPTEGESSAAREEGSGKKEGKKEKSDKVKVAKKIAKDMERWAKSQNQKKDMVKGNFPAANSSYQKTGAADAGFAILEGRSRLGSLNQQEETARPDSPIYMDVNAGRREPEASTVSAGGGSGLVAAYGGGSDTDEEIDDVHQEEKQHVDWNKLVCLLCKRQFPTREALNRHQMLSDLHKQNLEQWYRSRGLDPNDPQQRNNKYRDRAKERRLKYGEPDRPRPDRLKEKFLKAREEQAALTYEEPTKGGIGADNKGNRLLQKMGWQEGMGLGKSNQGRTSIIEAERRVATAGLGSKSSSYAPLPGETYKDCVKKMMYARYHELAVEENGES